LVRCYIAMEHRMVLPYMVFDKEVDTADSLLLHRHLQKRSFLDILLLRIDDNIEP
jgi:hypothetical protein